ncbi:MAG: HupE/UreJ family protein [Acidobacteria bacterium]|nr:HupE/UreJ family protein [Acidobacteriota bacterium]
MESKREREDHQDHQTKRADLIACLCLALILVLVAAVTAFAHDPGLSVLELRLAEKGWTVQITFARDEIAMLLPIDSDRDGQITQSEFEAVRSQLESIARQALIVKVDGRDISPIEVSATLGDSNALYFNLNYPAAKEGRLNVSSPLIAGLARGHRQFMTIRNDEGIALGESLLDAKSNSFESDIAMLIVKREEPYTFRQFLQLGVEHILMGFDHLAFLFALLLAGSSFREAAKIITSFTAAHSITLALATLDIVTFSPAIVEPLIAVSIVYVGLENIIRGEAKWRWLLTFGFGLIHGFGFASVLREMGIGARSGSVLMPLFSFNLGVELGQIVIAALVLPLIWKLRQQPNFITRYVPACSLLIALAGSYWLIERTLL